MYIVITVLIILVCILLTLAVLIQNPKGSGLGAGFGNIGNQVMGARRASDFMEKATWTLVIVLLALSLLSALYMPDNSFVEEAPASEIEDMVKDNVTTPTFDPSTMPTDGGADVTPQDNELPTPTPDDN